ncbi:MAG: ATP-binding protein [Candidatus Brocadiae bacterium]|nr:ATP-binding protein [Candidatus Brocadiia bacterium]
MINETIHLEISSNPKLALFLRRTVSQISEMVGFDEEETNRIALAIDEAFTNIIKHSYKMDFSQKVRLVFSFEENSHLGIEIQDDATPLNKEKIKSRNLEEVRPGGLGVHLIHCIMDKIEYTPGKKKGNSLYMYKKLLPK